MDSPDFGGEGRARLHRDGRAAPPNFGTEMFQGAALFDASTVTDMAGIA